MWSHKHGPTERLHIDPVACDGVGICSHLAPAIVAVDSWGYPILSTAPLSRADRRAAKRAVNGCPKRALFLDID
jgi:ferredoxin